jgi:hypothetical protein
MRAMIGMIHPIRLLIVFDRYIRRDSSDIPVVKDGDGVAGKGDVEFIGAWKN